MFTMKRSCALLALLLAAVVRADIIVLVDETFTSGAGVGVVWTSSAAGVSAGQPWTWSSPTAPGPTATEVWTGTGGATARGLATTYDHDQDGGTAAVNIPGGLEVMSSAPSITTAPGQIFVAALRLSLPADLDPSIEGTASFFGANRISSSLGGRQPRFSIYNVTEARDILAEQILTYPLGSAQWNYQSFQIPFVADDAGDLIELRFKDQSESGARGLEVADVDFSVSVVPEPSTALLLLLGLPFLRRRR